MDKSVQTLLQQCGADKGMLQKLERYVALLKQWNKAINLVSASTMPAIWERHILDSAQLWPLIAQENAQRDLVDLGSGGGLPGIVLGIGGFKVTMIESDARKCVFLRETIRELGLPDMDVRHARIEQVTDIKSSFVTARALAPLPQLVEWARNFMSEKGTCFFLKGATAKEEMTALPQNLQDLAILFPSISDKNGSIIRIRL